MTQNSLFNSSKKQFYAGEGSGRDTYIYQDNGGFYPMKSACQIESLGKLAFRTRRFPEPVKRSIPIFS